MRALKRSGLKKIVGSHRRVCCTGVYSGIIKLTACLDACFDLYSYMCSSLQFGKIRVNKLINIQVSITSLRVWLLKVGVVLRVFPS